MTDKPIYNVTEFRFRLPASAYKGKTYPLAWEVTPNTLASLRKLLAENGYRLTERAENQMLDEIERDGHVELIGATYEQAAPVKNRREEKPHHSDREVTPCRFEIPLRLDLEADENGVFDGREIARQLIRVAFQAMIPYADGCPGCADRLFTAVAESAMTEVHQDGLIGSTYARGEEATKPERFHAHAEATMHLTEALLGGARHSATAYGV